LSEPLSAASFLNQQVLMERRPETGNSSILQRPPANSLHGGRRRARTRSRFSVRMLPTGRKRVLVLTGLVKSSLPHRPTDRVSEMLPLDRGEMGGYKGGCNKHFDDL
jgi:hypothetical protein